MRKILSASYDHNLYFTEADVSAQSPLDFAETTYIDSMVRLYGILSEHVVLAASHIYESPCLYNYLLEHPEMIETGIITADLRGDCRDFKDFQEFQAQKTGLSIWNNEKAKTITNFLNKTCPYVIPWKPSSSENLFKQSLLNSLEDTESSLRRSLQYASEEQIKILRSRITENPRVTRDMLLKLVTDINPVCVLPFMKEVSIAYYIVGSMDLNSHLALHPALFQHMEQSISMQSPRCIGATSVGQSFIALLQDFEYISSGMLNRLSIEQLVNLRESKVMKSFRKKWWSFVTRAVDQTGLLCPISQNETILYDFICDEILKERHKREVYVNIKDKLSVAGLCLGGLSLANSSMLSGLSFGISLLSFSKLIDPIFDLTAGVEFTAITRKIHSFVRR